MADLDQLRELLRNNNVFFDEIIENEQNFKKIQNKLSETTLVVNDHGELWAFKLCSTQIRSILELINLKNEPKILLDWLQKLTNLQHLDIGFNGLGSLPDGLQKLTNLQHLNISWNNLGSLPDWLQKLTNLQTLNISFNSLGSLPDWLQKLTNLQTLNISGNNLGSLPDWLQKLTNLQHLNISHNGLESLPDWLQKLTNLQHLNISNNGLGSLPDWLQKLTNLQTLNIGGNNLGSLPDWLQKLTNLQHLNISNNGLRSLPKWLQKLTNLQTLNISDTSLGSLPDWLQKLTNLQHLNISNNSFQTLLPSLIPFLQKLNVSLSDVSIADVPSSVIEQGWVVIGQHYAEEDQKDVPLAELKIMIIGAGNSGKSCIAQALEDNTYDDKKPSTIGIELSEIRHILHGQEWVLRMWDFGGQEAYAATQTLFMTNQTLYLVVADGRTESRPDLYLHYVKTFAEKSPIILIINKIDDNKRADLNRQLYLDERIQEIIRFSCVKNRTYHVNELFEKIGHVLNKNPELRTQLKPRWLKVKNDLVNDLTKNGKYIDAEVYNEICKRHGLSEAVGKTVRNTCEILGEIFSYTNEHASPPIDWIMHPKWVTNGINCLFGLPQVGFYKIGDIYSHMRKQKYTDNEVLAILNMLKDKKLVLEDVLSAGKYFIPALLPNKNISFPRKAVYTKQVILDDRQPDVVMCNREIRYRYPFLHPIVKQVFMVKLYGDDTKNPILYRDGVCWEHSGVHIVMMAEVDDLAFYLKGNTDRDLYDAQTWILSRMEDVNKIAEIKSCELWHVFHVKDTSGSIHSKQYSHEDLCKFLDYGIEKIPLHDIRHSISIAEILKGLKPTNNNKVANMTKNVTNNIYGGTCINQIDPVESPAVGRNEGTINYIDGVSDSELQDFLKQFLGAQKKSSESIVNEKEKISLTDGEIKIVQDIKDTKDPEECKKRFKEIFVPGLNIATAVTNIATAMINFSNAHPHMWTGVKAFFSFLKG
jgi:small GTP-binding protein